MRTTWNGAISFGLVTIPVGLAPATKPSARQSDVSFRLLHRECKTPIKQKRWCPLHDREVGPDEVVRGWEVSKGEFVIVEDADLEAIERDATSRAIDITSFVPNAEIDPVYFDRTYFLVPAEASAQRRPYVLLLEAMRETDTAAIGSFVLAGKEKLALIRPRGDALVLETLFVAEDVYAGDEIEESVRETETKKPEIALALQVIESLAGHFEPDKLVSEYRQELRALLEEKLSGAPPSRPEPEEEVEAPAVDLMEALRQSVAEAKKRRTAAEKPAADGKATKGKAKAAPKRASRAKAAAKKR